MVMGILNVTPDSFHDGGTFNTVDNALEQAGKMLAYGTDILDIGGASSRPGSAEVPVKVELERTIPVIEAIKQAHPKALISIDTWRSEVATKAVQAGAGVVNDISAGALDKDLFETVAELGVPYVLMHMQGTPSTMQQAPQYVDVLGEVMHFFSSKLNVLHRLGVKDIILDPGFGFGKTTAHNFTLLKHLNDLKIFDKPILVGLSRKRMINEVLGTKPEEALNGTTVLNTLALQKGAAMLRVHDVHEAKQCIQLFSHEISAE